jgi:hypothetical protein
MSDDEYREFEEALTDVLTETAYSLRRRTRLANARAAVDQHDPRYIEAVNRAFLMVLNQGPRQMGSPRLRSFSARAPEASPLTLTHHATSSKRCPRSSTPPAKSSDA